jgi:membrane dipeptidase
MRSPRRRPPLRALAPLAGLLLGAAALLPAGCAGPKAEKAGSAQPVAEPTAEQRTEQADALAHRVLLVDTHVDVPYRLVEAEEPVDLSQRGTEGNFDAPRAREGGPNAPFMSIYIPAKFQDDGGAKAKAYELIDLVEGFVEKWPDDFAPAASPAEVRSVVVAGKIALPMGMENGAAVEDDLANLSHFYDRGIRYITLTHSENNQICDSSYADGKTWNGLSPFGREVVAEMNRLGIMVDISHVSDDTFWQVIELSKAPLIASHSSCRHFTPGWQRNMSDEMIKALAEKGGVIQINFGSGFLTEAARNSSDAASELRTQYLEANGYESGGPESDAWMEAYRQEHPFPYATLADVVAQIDHAVELAGIDHVGFGSDFDGVGDSLPEGLKDVSDYPDLIAALLDAGYSEQDVEKIAGGNLMRVWGEVERVAAELQGGAAPAGG